MPITRPPARPRTPDAERLRDHAARELPARGAGGPQQRQLAPAVERHGEQRLGEAEPGDQERQDLERPREAEGAPDGVLVIGIELALREDLEPLAGADVGGDRAPHRIGRRARRERHVEARDAVVAPPARPVRRVS